MTAGSPEPPRTVGQLIARLQQFDPDQEVVTANAAAGDSGHFQWILEVAPLPPAHVLVGIIYMPPE
jgi:hypothetical protein